MKYLDMFKILIKNTVISCAVLLVCWVCAFLVGLVIEIVDYIPIWVLILSFVAVFWAGVKTALEEGEDMKYIVKMRNPKTGKIEAYETKAGNRDELQSGLDFWKNEAGYEIILVEEKAGDC